MKTKESIELTAKEIFLNRQRLRACEIAGVIHYFFENGFLTKENLKGKTVDVGTGDGAGILALTAFGAVDVTRVDHSKKHYGFDIRDFFGKKFVHKTAREYLGLFNGDLSLITAFHANISFAEFYSEAIGALAPGGQLIVTTDIPKSVSYLSYGSRLNDKEWLRLDLINVPIADLAAFEAGELKFIPSRHFPGATNTFTLRQKNNNDRNFN